MPEEVILDEASAERLVEKFIRRWRQEQPSPPEETADDPMLTRLEEAIDERIDANLSAKGREELKDKIVEELRKDPSPDALRELLQLTAEKRKREQSD